VLDIEDAVTPHHKPEARATDVRWLEREEAWVRINDHSTSFWSDDVDQLKGLPGLIGVMLAKTESAEQVTEIDLRKALGLEKWNVFSHSYGTDLALIYMRQDADAIEPIVFDGVTPPSAAALGWTWASARQAFDNMVKACEDQPACKERYPDLGATFIRLVNELEAKPITTTVNVEGVGETKVVVDGGMLLNWFVPVATHLPEEFPSTVDELAHGNAQPIASRWAEV
jgi:hypothetical protein